MKKTKLNPKHLYAIFAFLLSAVVVFCGVQIWQEYSSRQKDIDAFAELSELAEIKEPDEPKETAKPDTDGDAENSDTDSDTQEEQENPVLTPRHDIPLLINQNSDCIGWIAIDNTAVDYPVIHSRTEICSALPHVAAIPKCKGTARSRERRLRSEYRRESAD